MAGISENKYSYINHGSEYKQVLFILQDVLRRNWNDLEQSVLSCMNDFTDKVIEKGLITLPTKEPLNFETVINEVKSSWNSTSTVLSLQTNFEKFYSVFLELPGSPEVAGSALYSEVQREVDKVLPGLGFLRVPTSTSEREFEFHLQDARHFKTEMRPEATVKDMNTESSSATKTDIDNSIFQDPEEVDDKQPSILHPIPTTIKSSSTMPHHSMVVLPQDSKYLSTVGVNSPAVDSHLTDSGKPTSKLNSPLDANLEKPLFGQPIPEQLSIRASETIATRQESDDQFTKPTIRDLDSELKAAYHGGSQRLSSASESSIMSDIYKHMREDVIHEKTKREEAEKKRENADKKRKKADKKKMKLNEKLMQAESRARENEEQIKKLQRDNEALTIELKAERKEKESLEVKLSSFDVISNEIKSLNNQRMKFTREKLKHKAEQEKLNSEMEKQQRKLKESEEQLNKNMHEFEKAQAQQNTREAKLKSEHERVEQEKKLLVKEQSKLDEEKRKFSTQRENFEAQKENFVTLKETFEKDMIDKERSIELEKKRKLNELEEEYAKMKEAKSANDKALEAQRQKLIKEKKEIERYRRFLTFIGAFLFSFTCMLIYCVM